MPSLTATAVAHPNIALIKYWGNRDDALRLPAAGSLSMNLAELETVTTVEFSPALAGDVVVVDGRPLPDPVCRRVSAHLDLVRRLANLQLCARVDSHNNFPMGAGLASSASGFAALTLAATAAAGLSLPEPTLSALARRGSGSACRSLPPGFAEWQPGAQDRDSFAFSIAPPEHWALVDAVAVVSRTPKAVSSTDGHTLAHTSPLYAAYLASAQARLQRCRAAVLARDFAALADVVEADSTAMHAVMMTSAPPLFYWEPETLKVMKAVRAWREGGLAVCYTVDAGPNVHCLCPAEAAPEVVRRLRAEVGVSQVLTATPGGGACLSRTPAG